MIYQQKKWKIIYNTELSYIIISSFEFFSNKLSRVLYFAVPYNSYIHIIYYIHMNIRLVYLTSQSRHKNTAIQFRYICIL